MKRYTPTYGIGVGGYVELDMREDPSGDYVEYDAVQKIIEAHREAIAALTDLNRKLTEALKIALDTEQTLR